MMGFTKRLFRAKSVMERLWGDHFGDLGYLPKKYGVQDARFTIHSSNGQDFTAILTNNHWKDKQNNSHILLGKKRMFPKTYKDQNDRIGKIYRFQWSFDISLLENRWRSRDWKKFGVPSYILISDSDLCVSLSTLRAQSKGVILFWKKFGGWS